MSAKEALPEALTGYSVRLRRRLGLYSQSEARVTVAQAGLGSLEVHTIQDQGRGSRPPKIVEAD
jgi:hypothetical protein